MCNFYAWWKQIDKSSRLLLSFIFLFEEFYWKSYKEVYLEMKFVSSAVKRFTSFGIYIIIFGFAIKSFPKFVGLWDFQIVNIIEYGTGLRLVPKEKYNASVLFIVKTVPRYLS